MFLKPSFNKASISISQAYKGRIKRENILENDLKLYNMLYRLLILFECHKMIIN